MAILDSTIINGDLVVTGKSPPAYVADGSNGVASATSYSCAFGAGAKASYSYAVAIGYGATSDTNSVAIGYGATNNIQGGVAIGSGASVTGEYGVSIGVNTSSFTGTVTIGRGAGNSGQYGYCTFLGDYAQGPTSENSTRIGCGSYTSTGRKLMLGTGSSGFTYMNAAGSSWSSASDIRDKTDIQEIEHSLDFIKKIHPITYVMNNRQDYLIKDENNQPILDENGKQQYDVEAHERGDKKKHRRFAGVSAQETYQALIDCYKDDNYAQIVDDNKYDNPDDEYIQQYSVAYERFIPFLIRAIQEQQEQIETLQARLEVLEGYNGEIENASSEE